MVVSFLSSAQKTKCINFAQALINQNKARMLIEPNQPKDGYWFGGGNMIADEDDNFYLIGRYRDAGDSRTGTSLGERGLELALFKSQDCGRSFKKVLSFSKKELEHNNNKVVSIEGSALRFAKNKVELFVSTEKKGIPYPKGLEKYKKSGTGVWTIDHLEADSIEDLKSAPIRTIISSQDPRWLHPKDPFFLEQNNGDLLLGFVTHPYNWSSYNAGYTIRSSSDHSFANPVFDFFPRGFTWDVVMTRLTHWLPVPRVGIFTDLPPLLLLFYDGGETVHRPKNYSTENARGYGCEEVGGLAVSLRDDLHQIERLSINLPLFLSPKGTGSSRYIDIMERPEGYYATWQQSQNDLSQPLVMNFLSREEALDILE